MNTVLNINNNLVIDLINNSNNLNVYRFGSIVYGTNSKDSDEDFIVVTKEKVISNNINVHYYTIIEFQTLLDNHDIQMLECFYLPYNSKFILKKEQVFTLNKNDIIDKYKLRIAISTITSNSWVKGKKKLVVQGDYGKYLAIKSVFHSIRILDYGIQIAQHNKIVDYTSMNYVMFDLLKLSVEYDYIELWNMIEARYKKLFNNKSSIFKQLCPKSIENETLISNLRKIFKEYNVNNDIMFNDIIGLIK